MLKASCSVTARRSLRKFLQENENIELLLGNGKTVVEQFERTFKVRFDKRKVDDLGAHIYCGDLLGKRFIGWSAFLSRLGNETPGPFRLIAVEALATTTAPQGKPQEIVPTC